MKKKFLTALMLSAVLVVPSYAEEMRTKITLKIENAHSDEFSHEVSGDFVDEKGIFTGSRTETRKFADSKGRSVTETETEFRNIKGELLMSADVAITARSEDFTVKSGEVFSETFSVDVTVSLLDRKYNEYRYTLGIEGLPEGFYASGELLSNDVLSVGMTGHHHEFAVYGTPENLNRAVMRFTAVVYVSGDLPVMRAIGSKDVTVSAEVVPKPPDEVPKSDDISPDVVPKPDDSTGTMELDTDTGSGTGTLADATRNMTAEEKAKVRNIKVKSNITDLTGLEEFTNLERLDLTEAHSLEFVDLRGNSSVKSVDIKGNNALKTLDISGSRVEVLDASGCEKLEEINVSGCTELKELNVSNTLITALNAEGCTSLEVLDCSSCSIEDLNLTGCESLNILDCSYNSLHRLDVYMLMRLYELRCEHQIIHGSSFGKVVNLMNYLEDISETHFVSGAESSDNGAENVINLRAWDSSGNEVTVEYDVETGIASFSEAPAKIAYDYITGFENVYMDVAVFADGDGYGRSEGVNPRGSGCNTVTVIPLFLFVTAAAAFLRMRKRE